MLPLSKYKDRLYIYNARTRISQNKYFCQVKTPKTSKKHFCDFLLIRQLATDGFLELKKLD